MPIWCRTMLWVLVASSIFPGVTAAHGAPAKLGAATTGVASATPSACEPGEGPLGGPLPAQLAETYPGKRFSAEAHDLRTGCIYRLHVNTDGATLMPTASVVKMLALGAVLLRAQDEGRNLTDWEASQLQPMITASLDEPMQALYFHLGGAAGLTQYARRFGMASTQVYPLWGCTATLPGDTNRLVEALVHSDAVLDPDRRAIARALLTQVRPSQRWGIGDGTAAVAPWRTAQKNGFAPPCPGWDGSKINTVGFVFDPTGGGYSLSVLSTGWPQDILVPPQNPDFVTRYIHEGAPAMNLIAGAVATDLAVVDGGEPLRSPEGAPPEPGALA